MVLSEFGNGWRLSTIFRILQKFYRISCFLSVSDDCQWFSWKWMFPKQFHSIQWFWIAFTQILDFHHSVILRSFFRTFRKKPWNFRLETFCFDCVVIIWFSFELSEESIACLLFCNISSSFFNFQGGVIEFPLNFHGVENRRFSKGIQRKSMIFGAPASRGRGSENYRFPLDPFCF